MRTRGVARTQITHVRFTPEEYGKLAGVAAALDMNIDDLIGEFVHHFVEDPVSVLTALQPK